MANLQVDQDLNATAQPVNDQNGNSSPLALSIDKVGVGTTGPVATLDVQGEIRSSGSSGGNLYASNPNNQEANVHLSWSNDVARIRVGGDGVGGKNGLDIQTIGNRSLMRLTHGGNVGIGTTSPRERLEVEGNIPATGDVRLARADCAENFDVADAQVLEPGTVMVIGGAEKLQQCTEAYDKRVAGVISGAGDCKPGMILGHRLSQDERMPLALTGKVFCKVDAQFAPVAVGDLLTTSPSPGYAMKATDATKAFGAVIGKALRPLTEGRGLIPILVALQ